MTSTAIRDSVGRDGSCNCERASCEWEKGKQGLREKHGDGARVIKVEEGRKTRKDTGVEKRGKRRAGERVRALHLIPQSVEWASPRLFQRHQFRERKRREGERILGEYAWWERCVRACVCLVVESVIDLFREEAGISGLREGSVRERERWAENREDERERERGGGSLA